jgi:hypothetical protein
VADVAFKALTAGLGVAMIYLTVTFFINVYRGFSWHSAQPVISQNSFLCFFTMFPLDISFSLMISIACAVHVHFLLTGVYNNNNNKAFISNKLG